MLALPPSYTAACTTSCMPHPSLPPAPPRLPPEPSHHYPCCREGGRERTIHTSGTRGRISKSALDRSSHVSSPRSTIRRGRSFGSSSAFPASHHGMHLPTTRPVGRKMDKKVGRKIDDYRKHGLLLECKDCKQRPATRQLESYIEECRRKKKEDGDTKNKEEKGNKSKKDKSKKSTDTKNEEEKGNKSKKDKSKKSTDVKNKEEKCNKSKKGKSKKCKK